MANIDTSVTIIDTQLIFYVQHQKVVHQKKTHPQKLVLEIHCDAYNLITKYRSLMLLNKLVYFFLGRDDPAAGLSHTNINIRKLCEIIF